MITITLTNFYRLKSNDLEKDLLVTKLEVDGSKVSFLKIGFYEYYESGDYNLLEEEKFEYMHLINMPVQAIQLSFDDQKRLRKETNI